LVVVFAKLLHIADSQSILQQLLQIPKNIVEVLEDIHIQTRNNPVSVINSRQLAQELMIPIAAILLEYPIAYVPTSSDETAFLSGQPLNVYECHLIHANGEPPDRHTLLKFSCPAIIGVEHYQLSSHKLIEGLKAKFVPRLQAADDHISVDIHVLTEKFDRVAL
jgi:hypothetical protein